jgi:hypothetical protein
MRQGMTSAAELVRLWPAVNLKTAKDSRPRIAAKAHFEMVRGDAGATRRGAEIVVKLAQENALTLFTAFGTVQSAWANAQLDGGET